LTLVGELARAASSIDFEDAFEQVARRAAAAAGSKEAALATRSVLDTKETLIERPVRMLAEEPHFLSAWLSSHRNDFETRDRGMRWLRNPLEVLADTYRLLHLDALDGVAANRIWDHDKELLDRGLTFYRRLGERAVHGLPWAELDACLRDEEPSFGIDAATWSRVRAAHVGHQLGLEVLGVLPLLGARIGFYDLRLDDDLGVVIPERLLDPQHQEAMRRVLVPPPATRADEIVAAMGGTYFSREAPGFPPYVTKGAHFEKGEPLYIIEVMKMFNKIYAPFSGTIDAILIPDDGVVVRKGEPLFKVTPDERTVDDEDHEERDVRRRQAVKELLAQLV
jgi:biotin carboxyl carrier protein